MRKNIGCTVLFVSVFAIVLWLVSYYIQPILPPELNRAGVLLFIAIPAVFSFFASINDIVDLVQKITSSGTAPVSKDDKIDKLIEKIQDNLHGDISQLPYVLTLVSDLCVQTGQSRYDLWLSKELHGYEDFRNFPNTFENEDSFEKWMEEFGNHRIAQTYVDVSGYVENVYRTSPFAYVKTFVPYTIEAIGEGIKVRKADNVSRVEVPMFSVGEHHVDKFVKDMAQHGVDLQPTEQTIIYFKLIDFEKLVARVRELIMKIINEARREISDKR